MDTFNVIAGTASIAGFLLTLWVFWKVRAIEAGFARQAMLPGFLSKFKTAIKNLRQYERQKDGTQIRRILTICRTNLADLGPLLSKSRADRVHTVDCSLQDALTKSDDALCTECGISITSLVAICETLDNHIDEMHWRGPNAK